jgi:hypothetical protein
LSQAFVSMGLALATLAHLSGGQVMVGIGLGEMP